MIELKKHIYDETNGLWYELIKSQLSQEQLAELANISSVHIGYIERGERLPSLDTIINIANALTVTADELLSGSLIVSSVSHESDDSAVLFDCSKEEYARITRIETSIYIRTGMTPLFQLKNSKLRRYC